MWELVLHLNVFRWCKFLRFVGNVMVLFVLAIVGFTWYAIVPARYARYVAQGPPLRSAGAVVAILLFTCLVAMVLWSYFAAALTDPGRVPEGWSPFADEQAAQAELDRLATTGAYAGDKRDPRRPRYCKHCRAWKPERAHHCSVMGRCVLKMDHYCIWVVNCVGLINYKFFLQFLGYTFAASAAAVALSIKPMIDFLSGRDMSGAPGPFIVVVLDGAFVAALIGFIAMHWQLIAHGCTTIEMYEKERPSPWLYDRGLRRNFEDVMGRSKLSWLLPRHTPDERQRLLESCLGQRLLPSGGDEAV
ncbi:MAG: DHHC palmitoyltransferase-domain-containing protein [Monoraphidium minutum]|nr:MAG: DHHC palmitoyltransferase-domain-containing protein [Monoraphidium minutum]